MEIQRRKEGLGDLIMWGDTERSTANWSATQPTTVELILAQEYSLLTVVSILGYTAPCCYETWVGSTISSPYSIPIFIVSCHGASWYKVAQLGGWCNLIRGTSNMTTLPHQQTVLWAMNLVILLALSLHEYSWMVSVLQQLANFQAQHSEWEIYYCNVHTSVSVMLRNIK